MRQFAMLLPAALGCYEAHVPADPPELVADLCGVPVPEWDLQPIPDTVRSLYHDIAATAGATYVSHVAVGPDGANSVVVSIATGSAWRQETVLDEDADLRETRVVTDGSRVVIGFVRDFAPCLAMPVGVGEWATRCFDEEATDIELDLSVGVLTVAFSSEDDFVMLVERADGEFERSAFPAPEGWAWSVDVASRAGERWLLTTVLGEGMTVHDPDGRDESVSGYFGRIAAADVGVWVGRRRADRVDVLSPTGGVTVVREGEPVLHDLEAVGSCALAATGDLDTSRVELSLVDEGSGRYARREIAPGVIPRLALDDRAAAHIVYRGSDRALWYGAPSGHH